MKKISLISVFIVSTIFSSLNYAADRDRAGAASFTLGGGPVYFSSKRHIENTGINYGALGYDFTDHWGIEGLLGFFNTTSHRDIDDGRSVNGTLFLVDGLYNFSSYHAIEPYVLAGVGLIDMNPNGEDANAEGNINAGVGAKLFFNQAVALRLEARDLYTMVGGKNDVYLDGGVTFYMDFC